MGLFGGHYSAGYGCEPELRSLVTRSGEGTVLKSARAPGFLGGSVG